MSQTIYPSTHCIRPLPINIRPMSRSQLDSTQLSYPLPHPPYQHRERQVGFRWRFNFACCLIGLLVLVSPVLILVAVAGIGTIDPATLPTTYINSLNSDQLRYDTNANQCIVQTSLTITQSGTIYAFAISAHPSYGIPSSLRMIQARVTGTDIGLTVTIINTVPITIASLDPTQGFTFYFNSTQLFQVKSGDLLGFCFNSRPFFLLDSTSYTTNYKWTPNSFLPGSSVTFPSVKKDNYNYPFDVQVYQWNVNITDLNAIQLYQFYSPRAPPPLTPIIGLDAFSLPSTLLGDTIFGEATETSNTRNKCIVPNVPVTAPTLVYGFSGSDLEYNPNDFIIKLIQIRMINPPTVIPSNSSDTVVKLIQSVDINIGLTLQDFSRFDYSLPIDQLFYLQPGDFFGYCIDDTSSSTDQSYFQFEYRNDGHSVFSFDLDYFDQAVFLTGEVYDFNAVGWSNIARGQMNDAELAVFLERAAQISLFTRATFLSGLGPYSDATAPIFSPRIGIDPSTLTETRIGSVVTGGHRENDTHTCTVIQPGTIGRGTIYGLRSSQIPALTTDVTIQLLYGFENYNPVFSIVNQVNLRIPASNVSTAFEFYFTWEQLFAITIAGSDRFVGWCNPTGQPSVFSYLNGSSTFPHIHQWQPVSYQSFIYSAVSDQRLYDFQLLQWTNVSVSDLNETETRSWLNLKGIGSNLLRPNTYTPPPTPIPPHSINPVVELAYAYDYGYKYDTGSSFDFQAGPRCYLYDTVSRQQLKPSIVYAVESGFLSPTANNTNLTIIIARKSVDSQNQLSFNIHLALDLFIPASDVVTKLIYYFSVDELIETHANDFIGFCEHADGRLGTTGDFSGAHVYEWSSDNSTVGSLITQPESEYLDVDFLVHAWTGLTLQQLNLTKANEFLVASRQAAGDSRGRTLTTNSSGGGLSSEELLAIWVSCLAFGVGMITCSFAYIVYRRRSMLRAALSPLAAHPPNHHAPAFQGVPRRLGEPDVVVQDAAEFIEPEFVDEILDIPPDEYHPEPVVYGEGANEFVEDEGAEIDDYELEPVANGAVYPYEFGAVPLAPVRIMVDPHIYDHPEGVPPVEDAYVPDVYDADDADDDALDAIEMQEYPQVAQPPEIPPHHPHLSYDGVTGEDEMGEFVNEPGEEGVVAALPPGCEGLPSVMMEGRHYEPLPISDPIILSPSPSAAVSSSSASSSSAIVHPSPILHPSSVGAPGGLQVSDP